MDTNKGGSVVRIDTDVLDAVRKLADRSGCSYSELVSKALRYAIDHAEIKVETRVIEVKTVVFGQ